MELSYRQLERTLVAALRIHPQKEDTFRSRIKQLQRLGFPPGVNVGQGAKMGYTAAHLFQMATALELMNGADVPAGRATSLVADNWDRLAAGYALAVQNLNRGRFSTSLFTYFLTRAFGDLQIQPYPDAKNPLLAETDWTRVVVADQNGLATQLLPRNDRRLAHGYRLIAISDLAVRLLKAVEDNGGVITGRRDQEFVDWLPPENRDPDGWLFISFDPWEPEPTAYQGARGITTEEQVRLGELAERTAQMSGPLFTLPSEVGEHPDPKTQRLFEDTVDLLRGRLSDDGAKALILASEQQLPPYQQSASELWALGLIHEPRPEHLRPTNLGFGVLRLLQWENVKSGVAEAAEATMRGVEKVAEVIITQLSPAAILALTDPQHFDLLDGNPVGMELYGFGLRDRSGVTHLGDMVRILLRENGPPKPLEIADQSTEEIS